MAGPAQEPRKPAFQAVNYEVNVSLDPPKQSLEARVRVDLEARSASRIVEVELHPNLRVKGVTDAEGKPLEFEQNPDAPLVLRVTLPDAKAAGDKVSLTFEYAGRLVNEDNSPVKGVMLARIAEDGGFLLLPARWFPLTSYPGGRYTATFNIEVPDTVAVVGTGKAAAPVPVAAKPVPPPPPPAKTRPGRTPPAAPSPQPAPAPATPAVPRTLYSFSSVRPEAGGTFVFGNIQVVPVRSEGLEVPVYMRAGQTATASAYGESLVRILNYFSAEFGPLVQPTVAIAQIPDGSVQAYAAPGLLLVSQRQWDPKVNYRLLARLAAQQWWGHEVMPASPADVWLSDGLSRYLEAFYVENLAGVEGFNRSLEDFAVGALMFEDAAPVAQAYRLDPFTGEYRAVVMNKGAMVFHMLRSQMGDDAFRALLREFYVKFAGKTATLEDFEKLAQEKYAAVAREKNLGLTTLTPFFAQWLNSTGVPEFQIEYVVYRMQKGFRIVGKVKQDLDTFRLPVELKVDTDGNPETKTIDVIGTNSDFTVETFGRPKPNGITLDPNNHLLKSSSKLRVRADIARGEDLAETGQFYEAIQQYQRALEREKNNALAHFRMGEAFFYQKNLQAAANAFRDAQVGDYDLNTKWVVVWSHLYLGKIFDLTGQRERAINEYQKAVETNDDTGGAQAEAQKLISEPYKEEARRAGP
jgi:tetratricopeptide (TPR) repeat protein